MPVAAARCPTAGASACCSGRCRWSIVEPALELRAAHVRHGLAGARPGRRRRDGAGEAGLAYEPLRGRIEVAAGRAERVAEGRRWLADPGGEVTARPLDLDALLIGRQGAQTRVVASVGAEGPRKRA